MKISNSTFENFYIASSFIQIENHSDLNENFNILFENNIFSNISLKENYTFDFIAINDVKGSINLTNNLLQKISFFQNLYKFIDISAEILFNFSIFKENLIFNNILEIKNAYSLMMISVESNFNNKKEYINSGGFMSLFNVLYKSILNVTISDSFNGRNTFGIKIIDDSNRNASLDFISIVTFGKIKSYKKKNRFY